MAKFEFRLPKDTELTQIQRQAIGEKGPIFLSGVPGTGKTVVSIRRLLNCTRAGKKGIIFTYGKLLKKTIEEKLGNNPKTPVDNIHNWMWDAQESGNRKYLEVMTKDENITTTIEILKSSGKKYDEILVDEGQDLSINIYKILKELTSNLSISADDAQQINNRQEATNENEILKEFPNINKIVLDSIIRSTYEIYKFAIQFVPNNASASDKNLLERLKRDNSGAGKPFLWLENNLESVYGSIKDILRQNPTDTIGILFEKTLHIDEASKRLSGFEHTAYHNQESIPSELKNFIITTFKSAKGIEFDIVIIPYFLPDRVQNFPKEYYVGVTRAKSEVHFLAIKDIPSIMSHFDKNTYELIDNRG